MTTTDEIKWSTDCPTKPGWYLHKCMETDGEAQKIRVTERKLFQGTVTQLWCEPDIGKMLVSDYHENLTDSQWSFWGEL